MQKFYRQFNCWPKGINTVLFSDMPNFNLAKQLSMNKKISI
ncbi:MAG TPA: hypothetical protein PLF15_03115 [bacterium]|nr:hypothetical protein [bacterium]